MFKENGRLGNQIFQYCGLRSYAKKGERVCLLGFNDFQTLLTGFDATIINQNSTDFERTLYQNLYRVTGFLSDRKVLPRITQDFKNKVFESKSVFGGLKYTTEFYSQSEGFIDPLVAQKLRVKSIHLKKAEDIIRNIPLGNRRLIFVHVRRRDYIVWPKREFPAVLSEAHFKKCMNAVQRQLGDVYFIITSDDKEYVRHIFNDIENKYIASGNAIEDFALMSLCDGGILSASSYSWWAAYFIHNRNNKAILIAPRYWAGHRSKEWYPKGIRTSFLQYYI